MATSSVVPTRRRRRCRSSAGRLRCRPDISSFAKGGEDDAWADRVHLRAPIAPQDRSGLNAKVVGALGRERRRHQSSAPFGGQKWQRQQLVTRVLGQGVLGSGSSAGLI